jgi:hypothetical protein
MWSRSAWGNYRATVPDCQGLMPDKALQRFPRGYWGVEREIDYSAVFSVEVWRFVVSSFSLMATVQNVAKGEGSGLERLQADG